MKINENIFREYDIRGIVELDFSKDVVESLGKAFGVVIVAWLFQAFFLLLVIILFKGI